MKISELILTLYKIHDNYGDREVYIASDQEGNGFYNLADGLKYSTEFKGKSMIIYPNEEKDYDEIK